MLVGAGALAASPAAASRASRARDLVQDAADALDEFAEDDNYENLWANAAESKALVIIPEFGRGGFFFGAGGGNAVVIARRGGGWTQPHFMRISSVSFGFQAGIEKAAIVLVVRSEGGVNQLLSSDMKIGADLSISAGPVGGGAKVQTTDIVAYSKSEGLFGAVSVEGVVLKVHKKFNEAYYGREVSPNDILVRGAVSSPASAPVHRAANRLAAKGR